MTAYILSLAVTLVLTLLALCGLLAYSRGGGRLSAWCGYAFTLYGIGIFGIGLVLDATNSSPYWINGPDGYGALIPIASAVYALLASAVIFACNRLLARQAASRAS